MLSRRMTQKIASATLAAAIGLFPVCALADEPQALALPTNPAAVAVQVQEEPTAGSANGDVDAPVVEKPTATVDADASAPKTQDMAVTERPSEASRQTGAKADERPGEATTIVTSTDAGPNNTAAQLQEGAAANESVGENDVVGVGTAKGACKENRAPEVRTATTPATEPTGAMASTATAAAKTSPAPAAAAAMTAASQATVKMYRIYNQWSGEHLFTSNIKERDFNVALGWTDEGIGWQAPKTSKHPVFRLYNPYSGDHHYTTSKDEYDHLGTIGWKQEKIGFYSPDNESSAIAVYRLFNPYETIGTHHYTLSKSEYDHLGTIGWRQENVGWYAIDVTSCDVTASFADKAGSIESVVSTNKGGVTYVILPSYANASSVTMGFSANGSARDARLTLPSGTANIAAGGTTVNLSHAIGSTIGYSTRLGSHPLVVLKSANVGTVFVTSVDASKGRAWVEASADHSAKANVDVTMVASDGSLVYDRDGERHSTIKGRGNNTWSFGIKKPYQISLSKKADLLKTGSGDNANKKWVLLANENDATLLHNTVAYNMGLELGIVGCEGTPVDLYYDGEYRGSYYLCEKVEIRPGRVDIHRLENDVEKANKGTDLDSLPTARGTYSYNGKAYAYQYVAGVKDPKDITGGYLVEKDGAYYAKETCWFDTSIGIFVVKSPEVASQSQVRYIAEQFQAAIDAMQNNRFNLAGQASFDLDGLAKSYLVSEFTKNIDFFYTSTYFYKDRGSSVIHAEPLWDFDGSMGVRTDGDGISFMKYSGYSVPGGRHLRGIPSIRTRAQEIWRQELGPLMTNLVLGGGDAVGSRGYLRSLSCYRRQISASQAANQAIFGMGHFPNEFAPFPTYEQNYRYLVSWLTWRTEWFDRYFANAKALDDHTSSHGGTDYGLVYDYDYYVENHPKVIAAVGADASAVLAYFVENDMPRGVRASLNFDLATYKARYADLSAAFGKDWASYYRHFMTHGFYEGRMAT
ncbi:MAG: CotH kinase family protein [Coriobacteriaceae bacterium]|nr:CotH kinase family protein [Coriobacteriaceae bacterium]